MRDSKGGRRTASPRFRRRWTLAAGSALVALAGLLAGLPSGVPVGHVPRGARGPEAEAGTGGPEGEASGSLRSTREEAMTMHWESVESVADLFRQLDGHPELRRLLVPAIATRGGAAAWEGLIARLRVRPLRTEIETALGRRAPAEVIAQLKLRLLASPDAEDRASLMRILAATADARHGPEVLLLLAREGQWIVRHAAIVALGRFGDPPSADVLVEIAARGGVEGRVACFALGDVTSPPTVRALSARWRELPPAARAAVLRAAGGLGDEDATAAAREGLFDADPGVRLEALCAMGEGGESAIEPLLGFALSSRDDEEAERAVRLLASIGTPAAAEAGLLAVERLPPDRQAPLRDAFRARLN